MFMMRHLQEPPLWSRVVSGLETSLFSFAAIGVLSFTAIGVLGISSTGVVFAQDQTRQFSMKTAEIINEPIELYWGNIAMNWTARVRPNAILNKL